MIPRKRRWPWLIAAVLACFGAYLAAWPVAIEPVAWTPPPAPEAAGVYAPNERLRAIERLAAGMLVGPEYLDVDAQGRLYTGTLDGRLLRLEADGSGVVELARTGGRPIGLRVLRDGTLIVADGARGLLRVAPGGVVEVLASSHDGLPFGLTDDVAVSADERVAWFTDASNRHGVDDHLDDILEHGGRGRLLRIDLATHETTLLRDGLEFANGVVPGPGERYLLVCETGSYRVLRHWLAGPRAGQTETFADNLPGFPDNITFDGRDHYWVALANPRNAALDRLGPYPRLRKVVARLPPFLRPQPVRHGYVVALDLDGRVVDSLQYAGDDAYAPVTTVRQIGDWLYLGSLDQPAIARVRLRP
ncbi:MAG TPA: SMP-30/gluconolactonase/LRE family protein [Pseudomonadota bacterium]|nr:SMP-30/gluconolactonase/LRE family protein [Pseudomonadota bacterium]